MKRICIIGISGKLGRYMTAHSLDRGYDVVGVCRPESIGKLGEFGNRVKVVAGRTSDAEVVASAVEGCDGVLTVLVPWGTDGYATRTARAVLAAGEPGARLIFSCGWHVRRDRHDRYSPKQKLATWALGAMAKLSRMADLDDQVLAARLVFKSETAWTVVRASDLEEGESEGLPVWARHVGDPILASNRTRRTDFALFMVNALTDDRLIGEAPAIVSRASASARAHRRAAKNLSS